ncbi:MULTISPECIES: ABC transporter permease [Gemmobacter]|jgi:peptide/nickel transport system permease protein|uniref:Peptide/nickel transport system permease protein n=2 Tax=Gemmobacter TaxID=204456 RepID=A0A2T6BBM7_9RHOB|nr:MULTISPECIES: ABC transporter permease [Gemmobacter]OJY27363.1 MAG: ABC transporter substrate-binding protein [Rhodobacterales bacterium 65-51]PTX53432.1 peptide/nickel transport system permease protein [Gemmobacter caeni]TWJ05543.1 peptide/nickel transport system permease protein [Gemmobacter caeni]GHC15336.1 ABC transporter substrate-binding protein [Gemmobacter nanjingensis]
MLTFTIRRLLLAIPTLLFISLVIFLLLELAPGDPMSEVPLTVPPEVKQKMREALGADQPMFFRYMLWLKQFFVIEPLHILGAITGYDLAGDAQRIISWQSRSPVADIIAQRIPQTLTVIGAAYLIGVLIALPIGIYSAYRQYSWFDQLGTFISMIGFSVPTFFTGVLLIVIFSVKLGWFPSIYDTTLRVTDWASFGKQVKQMVLPVSVLALYNAAQISRYMRSSMLDNLGQDYVRTARSVGMTERVVVLRDVLRNSMIPVVTVIALGIPTIFGGAIITEQVFKVNGLGQLLISAIHGNDLPMVQTLTFIFAILIVLFNLIADILYGILDPRIRYD